MWMRLPSGRWMLLGSDELSFQQVHVSGRASDSVHFIVLDVPVVCRACMVMVSTFL